MPHLPPLTLLLLALLLLARRAGGQDVGSALATALSQPLAAFPCTPLLALAPLPAAGCASPRRAGATGLLVPVDSPEALAAFLALPPLASASDAAFGPDAASPSTGYAAVLPPAMVTAGTLAALSARGAPFVAGALALPAAAGDAPYSDAAPAPFNPRGRGTLAPPRYAVPVFAVDDPAAAALVLSRARANAAAGAGAAFPQFAVRFRSYMGPAALDSGSCLAAQPPQCLPVGGQSVWAALGGLDAAANASAAAFLAAVGGTAHPASAVRHAFARGSRGKIALRIDRVEGRAGADASPSAAAASAGTAAAAAAATGVDRPRGSARRRPAPPLRARVEGKRARTHGRAVVRRRRLLPSSTEPPAR